MTEVEEELAQLSAGNVGPAQSTSDASGGAFAFVSMKEALDEFSKDSGLRSSLSLLVADVFGDENLMIEVKETLLSDSGLKIKAFDRVLQVEENRLDLLHQSFQKIINEGENIAKTLADVYGEECSRPQHIETDKLIELGYRLGDFLTNAAYFAEGETVYQVMLNIKKQSASPEDLSTCVNLCARLIHVTCQRNDFLKAEQTWDLAQEMLQKLESQNHTVNKALLYCEYSRLLLSLSRYDMAYQYSYRALHEADTGLSTSDISLILCNAAEVCQKKNRLQSAEMLISFAVQHARKHWTAIGVKLSEVLFVYGYILNQLDNLPKSLQVYKECLDIRKKVFPGNNWLVARTHTHLAYECYRDERNSGRRNFTTVKFHADTAIQMLSDLSPSPALALAKRGKALALQETAKDCDSETEKQEMLQDALVLQLEALDIDLKLFGENSFSTSATFNNLARTYHEMNNFLEAEKMYLKDISIKEKLLGSEHPDTCFSKHNLGVLYYNHMNRYSEAEQLFLECVSIREKISPTHSELRYSYNGLIHLYKKTGNKKQQKVYEKALDEWRKLQSHTSGQQK